MKPTTTAAHAANFFFHEASKEHRRLTLRQLLALTVTAQGWHLALLGTALFAEPVVAAAEGPVVSRLYHELKTFGDGAIDRPGACDVNLETGRTLYPAVAEKHADTRRVLQTVWDVHKDFDAHSFYKSLKAPETPWAQTRKQNPDGVIAPSRLQNWYTDRIRLYVDGARCQEASTR